MKSVKEVKRILRKVQNAKHAAKFRNDDAAHRVWTLTELMIKDILDDDHISTGIKKKKGVVLK